MTTGKTIASTRQTLVGKVMSLLFNMLSRLVITFLPRSKCLLISWLQSPFAVILEPPKIKSDTISTVSPSISHEVMRPDAMILESITMNKASGRDGISVELFQILKDDAVKVLHSICQQIWKTQQWPQDWKRSVCIPIPKKGNTKECSNYCTIALVSHARKVMLKILQARLQQYVNRELPDVQAGFRNQKSNCQHLLDHRKSKRVSEKHLFLLYWLCQSLWLCGSQ